MQYLLQNKINYLGNSASYVYINTITNQSEDFIIYTGNATYSFDYKYFNSNEQTSTSFNIANAVYSHICNNILYSIRPAFLCSDFLVITSNDSVTITLSADNITKEYTYPFKKQFMCCAPNIVGVIHNSKKLVVTATSTIPLTLMNIPAASHPIAYCDIIGM